LPANRTNVRAYQRSRHTGPNRDILRVNYYSTGYGGCGTSLEVRGHPSYAFGGSTARRSTERRP